MANTVNRKHGEPLTESELTATLAELDGQKMWDLYSEVADKLSPALVNGGLHR
jgi:hypothetical protein